MDRRQYPPGRLLSVGHTWTGAPGDDPPAEAVQGKGFPTTGFATLAGPSGQAFRGKTYTGFYRFRETSRPEIPQFQLEPCNALQALQ